MNLFEIDFFSDFTSAVSVSEKPSSITNCVNEQRGEPVCIGKRFRRRGALLLASMLLAAGTAAFASTSDLYFNINAGDPGSYSTSSPRSWNDLSSAGRNGTVVGTSGLTYNATTKALEFPGGSNSAGSLGYVDMGAGFNNFGSGITIEFEGHFGGSALGWERIFDFGNGAAEDNIWIGVLGDGAFSNSLALEIWNNDSSPTNVAGRCHTESNQLVANTFARWVITLDGTTCRMYKDGTEVSVRRMAGGSSVNLAGPSVGVAYAFLPRVVNRTQNYIGKSNWGVDPAFDGAIKYVRIYTKALSPAEVVANSTNYTLTYATSGADSGSAPAAQTGNGLVTLASNTGTMVKAGYVFTGWATASGAITALTSPYELTADVTLHPVWIPIPSAPRITATSASATSLSVAITAPEVNPSSVTGYQVEYSTDGTSWTVASSAVASDASSYTITGLTTGTPYYVRVAAKYAGTLSAYGYNWQKIHEVTSSKRTSITGPIVYASGFGLGADDAATTYASTAFTRIRYRMAATYGGSNNYVDADFKKSVNPRATYSESFDSIDRLRVPTPDGVTANQFEIQGDVADLSVASNVAGVETGSGFDGRLEIWPWNYDPAAPASTAGGTLSARAVNYDDSDTAMLTAQYGSFQLHRLSADSTKRRTIFAWNRHYDQTNQEVGFGQYGGASGHSDWTFAADDGLNTSEPRTNFNLQIFIDMPITPAAATYTISYLAGAGGSGTAPSSPSSVADGSTFLTPANTFTRAGHTFAGWSDGTATYAASATYPASGNVSGNVTLTATWTADAPTSSAPTGPAPTGPAPTASTTTTPASPETTVAPTLSGPTTVRPGRTLTMTAGGFTPGETVVISVDGRQRPQRLIADANGQVRLTITLTPDLRPGTVTVRASGASATVTRKLQIAAPITKLPETGGPSTLPVVAALLMILGGGMLLRRRRLVA